ncbi:hypothetical protein BV87_26490 (plasmid) [Sphingobium yanoikuyae]|nr:hypothetical protein BV87_26490 [Sphingobium yanoikuyae]RSU55294.1 hypothetical protein DAH51_17240 [Sphingobium yanoikuyae]
MRRSFYVSLAFMAITLVSGTANAAPLTIDDVLRTVAMEQVAASPDGEDLAVVVQRPAGEGEVAGRTFYEVDPSRADVWLVRRDGSDRRNLTDGHAAAAGNWCAQWSPDSKRIAFLSTRPEGAEPHGGDAVRLYMWTRATDGIRRISQQPMMTMTRYGSPLNALDLRGGADAKRQSLGCTPSEGAGERAPFLWLDEHRLLVLQMPAGQNSSLLTQNTRALEFAGEVAQTLRDGTTSTVDVADSGRENLSGTREQYQVEISLIDAASGERQLLASVPAFPFRGMLSLVVSPDRKTAAVLAPAGVIPPQEVGPKPLNNDETASDKRLILIDLTAKSPPRRVTVPEEARYPLDLLDWSPDSTALLLRARASGSTRDVRVFRLDASSGKVSSVAPNFVDRTWDAGPVDHELSARWLKNSSLLIRGRQISASEGTETWWYLSERSKPRPASPPTKSKRLDLPSGAQLLAQDRYGSIWRELTDRGVVLQGRPAGTDRTLELFRVNHHLASIDWGAISTIDYVSEGGAPLKALVIHPPGHRRGQSHPVLVWVYPGTMIRGKQDYWDDRLLPGIYNLQLYAAKGYTVLVPSMPRAQELSGGPYLHMKEGVLPAVDKLIELEGSDPRRVGLFGQSFGGYATYSLVTQTGRFAAAAAIDGIADMHTTYGAFDRSGDGWPGIAQDKGVNPTIVTTAMRMPAQAYRDPGIYAANSPIMYTSTIHTPLLMAHGTFDIRGSVAEAEEMFTLLDQQGKPARLLRYHGENHSIALSPANVRNLYDELIAWFDLYLKKQQ